MEENMVFSGVLFISNAPKFLLVQLKDYSKFLGKQNTIKMLMESILHFIEKMDEFKGNYDHNPIEDLARNNGINEILEKMIFDTNLNNSVIEFATKMNEKCFKD